VCRPSESKIRVLSGSRDTLPDSRQISALELTYNFTKTKAGEIVPDFCLLSSLLYESTYESQLWMLYDANKQLIDCGDAYTHQVCITFSLQFVTCSCMPHAARDWNSLPPSVRSTSSLASFCLHLKTHLFATSFPR